MPKNKKGNIVGSLDGVLYNSYIYYIQNFSKKQYLVLKWLRRWDSNPRPSAYEAD